MPCFGKGWTVQVKGMACGAVLPIAGCTYAPSINVLGAYFPDWLFCIVAGVMLTVFAYVILKRTRYSDRAQPAAVVYPALMMSLSLVVWLVFFQH